MKHLNGVNGPLSEEQAAQLQSLTESLTSEQLLWVSGYLAGLHARGMDGAQVPAEGQPTAQGSPQQAESADSAPLTILYGSETGNAEELAEQAAAQARELGHTVQVHDMAEYKTRNLRNERRLLVVTATHGEGDPPEGTQDFYEFLHGRKAPKLHDTLYAVLSLGDSSYEHFCQTGKDIDTRLEALGAQRVTDRIDCDVDYEESAGQWLKETLPGFPLPSAAGAGDGGQQAAAVMPDSEAAPKPKYDRRNPFPAEVLETVLLNGRGSKQETRHVELSLEGSGLQYRPGDVLGVVAENRDDLVEQIIEGLSLSADEPVETPAGGDRVALAQALKREYELTLLTPGVVGEWARLSGSAELEQLTEPERRIELTAFMEERQLIDLVQDYPVKDIDAATLLSILRRLQPREYSIASALSANPEEVHLTVAAIRYEREGQARHGLASSYLIDAAQPGDQVPVYIRPNKHFRLPDDPSVPIIMIGPGTGVAPYRAFLQEREEQGAAGESWLFFGNPHFRTDFLYQTEWQRWLADGVLSRIDLAFSRDQEEKVYVQHRMREHAAELYDWLDNGAHLFVCGDAKRMARDVHEMLETIIAEQGGTSKEEAQEYIKQLQREKRYQRDVY